MAGANSHAVCDRTVTRAARPRRQFYFADNATHASEVKNKNVKLSCK